MKWDPFLFTFVLNKMCDLIKSGVETEKGFNVVSEKVFEFSDTEVSSQQVYNHFRKWRTKWTKLSQLRDLRDAQRDKETKTIILEARNYKGHILVLTHLAVH